MKFPTLTNLCLIVTTLIFCAQKTEATHYKLFVLTGQSNSLGVTNGGEKDLSVGHDAADAHVIFAWHNVADPVKSLGHSGQSYSPARKTADFTTLQEQQGGFYPGSKTHWGPEIEFARTLYRAGVRDFGVIKVSRGGGGNSLWIEGKGHMYSQLVATVNQAVAHLKKSGHTFEIVGLLYLQGESDNAAEAAVAGTRVKELVDHLRNPLGGLPHADKMHAVIAGVAASGGNRDAVRAQQAAIAKATNYLDYFDNQDLLNELHDKLHFNRSAKITLGQRFAQKFFVADVVSRQYGKLVFIGDSITQGGNGRPSYRYQIFKNLVAQGVVQDAAKGYEFIGSQNGAYQNKSGFTPEVHGQNFANIHEGHFGWRAFWENGRIPLPSGRYHKNNLGQGTIENWTGKSRYFESASKGKIKYTGKTYLPDTAVIMIGINDLADGASAKQVHDDIALMIDQLQSANAKINIFLSQTLHTNQNKALDAKVEMLNNFLPELASKKSTARSCVWVIETDLGFDPVRQTYDKVHPNQTGEIYVGNRISGGLGIIETPRFKK